ncbi:MAG: hypothetical protein ACRCTJ_04080 [Brevinema sp.]
MKITNLSVNRPVIIRNNKKSSDVTEQIKNISSTIEIKKIELKRPHSTTESIEYLQHNLYTNQQAFGILSQLSQLIEKFIDSPKELEMALKSNIEQLAKTHTKYTQNLKNSELTIDKLKSEITKISDNINQDNQQNSQKILEYLVMTQNKEAAKTEKLDSQKIEHIKKHIVSEKNTNLVTLSSKTTKKLLD